MKKFISLLLALAIVFCTTACSGAKKEENKNFRAVTSFYPLYIMALNITDGVSEVQVDNMADKKTGCLHNYQLQSKDMKNIEKADMFIINGAGMERFMDKITSQIPNLRVVDSSKNIELIKDDVGEPNPHTWVSITNYIKQLNDIADAFIEADPKNAEAYSKNTKNYVKKLNELKDKMHKELNNIKHRDVITFHAAFPYFAKEFNLNIVKVINRKPGSQPSAQELADTIQIIKDSGVKAVFAEPQYPKSAANTVANESGAKLYSLDPSVTGNNDKNAYLNAMESNLKILKEALQ